MNGQPYATEAVEQLLGTIRDTMTGNPGPAAMVATPVHAVLSLQTGVNATCEALARQEPAQVFAEAMVLATTAIALALEMTAE